jgi:hypothetical protein
MAEASPEYIAPAETAIWKRISWPAVFGGTFVALATELLFTAFGLFIGFTLSSRGGVATWSKVWYFVTTFVALFLGAWVTAKLSTNTSGGGRLHGAVTWGLTTMATFAFITWMFWGAVSTSLAAVRTAAVATDTAAAAAPPATQAEAAHVQNQAANVVNQATGHAPRTAGTFVGDASTLFLVIFGGILCGCVASLIGGGLGGGGRFSTQFTGGGLRTAVSQAASGAKTRATSA